MKVLNTSNMIMIFKDAKYVRRCWVSLTAVLTLVLGEFAKNDGNIQFS